MSFYMYRSIKKIKNVSFIRLSINNYTRKSTLKRRENVLKYVLYRSREDNFTKIRCQTEKDQQNIED